jgi:asparagine synthetase B (glutamine-hydrolysing)
MAHSLEVREPLMDHPLVEWIATLPSDLKLRGQEGKYVFKKALEPMLPHDVLYRPKMGFGAAGALAARPAAPGHARRCSTARWPRPAGSTPTWWVACWTSMSAVSWTIPSRCGCC